MIENNSIIRAEGPAAETKIRILRAALDEFALHSPAGARSRKIAQMAGVNHAALCYHFGGKDEIYLEIIKLTVARFKGHYSEYFERARRIIESAKPSAEDAAGLIREMFMMQIRLLFNNTESAKMFLIMRREEIYPTPAFEILFDEMFRPLHMTISSLVNIVFGGKLTCMEAGIRGDIILTLVGNVMVKGETINRISCGKHLGEEKFEVIRNILADTLDKILDVKNSQA